jgi:hypothetical protein
MTHTLELTDQDDLWHEPVSADPHWTETSYWGFYVPERNVSVTLYNMWRKNLGLVASRVWVWDHRGDMPIDALYSSMCEHVVIPDDADPTNFTLPTGLSCERLAPLKGHRLQYGDEGVLNIDVTATALRPPVAAFHGKVEGTGHFDQHIHVTGTVSLWGEDMAVDCLSMRDRTWSVRSDYLGRQTRLVAGYMHGAVSEDDCWLVMAVGSPEHPEVQQIPAGTGSFVRDGQQAGIVSGVRRVTRNSAGRPERIHLEFIDDLGRSYEAHGVALNHLGTMLNPSIYNCWSLYRWTDNDGTVSFGESQETWIPLQPFQTFRHAAPNRS